MAMPISASAEQSGNERRHRAICATKATTDEQRHHRRNHRQSCSLLLDSSDVDKIVGRRLGTAEFRVSSWSLDMLGETNGFLGQYYTLSVTMEDGGSLRFFAKTPPPTTSPQYDFLVRHNTFNKEIDVYGEIIPEMGVGSGEKWLPDYYLGKNDRIIVLEDAVDSGYAMLDKYEAYGKGHWLLLARVIATLHSRSLILDERLRRGTGRTLFEVYGHLLEEVAFVESEPLAGKYLSSCVKGAWAMVDMNERLGGREAAAIKDWIGEWVPRLPELVVSSDRWRNVMCHRDLWSNNIMFKMDGEGKPVGCYLVDFQFLRYSPPAYDFETALILTTTRATRREFRDLFLDVYYDTVSKELSDEGLVADDCFPREEFVKSCEEARTMALAYAVANMQVMLLSKQAVEEYFVGSTDKLEHYVYGDRRPDLIESECRATDMYRTRITEVIEEIGEYIASKGGK